ncbi:hypothetical protein HK101_011042 [Irineochytrium annulatum]|nr:hypothetical protein HK101_011042 [Irineochytrium annulatum]
MIPSSTPTTIVVSAVNDTTELTAGFAIWSTFAADLRQVIRGSALGIPAGLFDDTGSTDASAVYQAYGGPMSFVMFLFFAVLGVVASYLVVCMCCLQRSRRKKVHKKWWKTIAMQALLASGTLSMTVAFISGIESNTMTTNFILNLQPLIVNTVNNTATILSTISSSVNVSIDAIETAIINQIGSVKSAVSTSSLSSVGVSAAGFGPGYTLAVDLAQSNAMVQNISTSVNLLNSTIASLLTQAQSLLSEIQLLNVAVSTMNSDIVAPSGSYRLSPALSLALNPGIAINASVVTLSLLQKTNWTELNFAAFTQASNQLISILANISSAVSTTLDAKISVATINSLSVYMPYDQAVKAEAVTGFEHFTYSLSNATTFINTLYNTSPNLMNLNKDREGFMFFLYVIGLIIGATVVALTILRAPPFLKGIFVFVALATVIFLALAIIFFMIALVLGDVCNTATSAAVSYNDTGLANTPFDYAPKFFYYRQTECVATDVGLVQFASSLGLMNATVGNITWSVQPIIQSFNFTTLGYLNNSDIVPNKVAAVIGGDPFSRSISAFEAGPTYGYFNTLHNISFAASLASVYNLLTSNDNLMADLNASPTSLNTPPWIAVVSGTVTYKDVSTSKFSSYSQSVATISTKLLSEIGNYSFQLSNAYALAKTIQNMSHALETNQVSISQYYNKTMAIVSQFATNASTSLSKSAKAIKPAIMSN